MNDNKDVIVNSATFESLKKTNKYGAEYWSARELLHLFGYEQWRGFVNAINKAIESCKQSLNEPNYHFADVRKMVEIGSGSARELDDFHLSRFACYLLAQNGDPRKPEIARAQKYFAIQTRKSELAEMAESDRERLELRQEASIEFKALSGAARIAGVQNSKFGIFHDAGYKGLYGGLGVDQIKKRKGIDAKEQLMDRMGTTELAANQFRMTQTREKLKIENITNQDDAIALHQQVGKEIRATIARIGGIPLEDIPAAEHIKNVAKRIKKLESALALEAKDTLGVEVEKQE